MPDANAAEPTGKPLPQMAGSAHKPEADAVALPAPPQAATPSETPGVGGRRWWVWLAGSLLALVALIEGVPWVVTAFRTVSTDDAYVNGHVTLVAPRVTGQVTRVLVDDNNRAYRGDLLVQLDKELYEVEVGIVAFSRAFHEVWKAYNDTKVALVKQQAAAALLVASEKAWAATLASYKHGLATFPDVREAERNLARARTLDQASRAEVLTRAAAFAFSTGDLARP